MNPASAGEQTPRPRRARLARLPGASNTVSLIALGIALAAAGILLAWILYLSRQALLLVYVSVLLATGIGPPVMALERLASRLLGRRLPRWVAVVVVYLMLGIVLVALAFTIFPTLFTQAQEFGKNLPTLLDRAQRDLLRRGALRERVTVETVLQQTPLGADTLGAMLGTVWGLMGGALGALTILTLTFYLVVEADDLFAGFVRSFPRRSRLRVRTLAFTLGEKVSAWLSGQLLLCAVIGTTAAVGLALLGVPYFYVLALIAAVGELIPVLGPIVAAVPAIMIASTVSTQLAITVVVFYVAQQFVENYVLVPRIMSQQVGLSSTAIIIALIIGSSLLGVTGAILAVPTAAILHVLYQELVPPADTL